MKDLPFTAVPAYKLGKPFNPRGNRWVGYVVTLEGRRVYVAGDTDDTPDARSVSCDVDRKSTRLNSSHSDRSRMPSSA